MPERTAEEIAKEIFEFTQESQIKVGAELIKAYARQCIADWGKGENKEEILS